MSDGRTYEAVGCYCWSYVVPFGMASGPVSRDDGAAAGLCRECGLCCDGVIFAHVKLLPADDAARLRALGLPVASPAFAPGVRRLYQPCAALEGCRCRIYGDRPEYCRQFECLLFKNVKAARTERARALGIIRTARERADKVRRLLRELGDTGEEAALSVRFRRTTRRLEAGELDEVTADLYARLTLAVHDLNYLVGDAFYPGSK